MRVTPSLPQRERQTKGSIPLDPRFPISPIPEEKFASTSRGHYIFYECLSGGGGKGCRNLKERQGNFPMNSTMSNSGKPPCPAVPRRGHEAGKSRKLNTHYLLNNKFSNG
jgi:hypothetical protein